MGNIYESVVGKTKIRCKRIECDFNVDPTTYKTGHEIGYTLGEKTMMEANSGVGTIPHKEEKNKRPFNHSRLQ